MKVSDVIDTIQAEMADSGVYRTDSFLLELYNDATKLLAAFTLHREQSTSVRLDGTRNYGYLPKVSGENCVAVLYVSDMSTGSRIQPAAMEDFEFYQSRWEGVMGTVPHYYTTTGRWSPAHSAIVFCPMSNYGDTNYYFVGAYVPEDYIADDTVDLTDLQLQAVMRYVEFGCFISEPARGEEALARYKDYLAVLEMLIKAGIDRFPSGRDTEPVPVELIKLGKLRYEPKKASEDEDEG